MANACVYPIHAWIYAQNMMIMSSKNTAKQRTWKDLQWLGYSKDMCVFYVMPAYALAAWEPTVHWWYPFQSNHVQYYCYLDNDLIDAL